MATRAQLEQALKDMPNVEFAEVIDEQNLIATVVSESFKDEDEAQRQERVWKYLREQLGPGALENIEFIFTNTPDEHAA